MVDPTSTPMSVQTPRSAGGRSRSNTDDALARFNFNDSFTRASNIVQEMESLIESVLTETTPISAEYGHSVARVKSKRKRGAGPFLIKPLNKSKARKTVNDMEFDPALGIWVGNDDVMKSFSGHQPSLIVHKGKHDRPKAYGNMVWDTREQKWRGNEEELRAFDGPKRPPLISNLNMSTPKETNGMTYDSKNRRWIGNDEDMAAFSSIEGEKSADDGFTVGTEFQLSEAMTQIFHACAERHLASLSDTWFYGSRAHLPTIRTMSIIRLVRDVRRAASSNAGASADQPMEEENAATADTEALEAALQPDKEDWDDVGPFNGTAKLKLPTNITIADDADFDDLDQETTPRDDKKPAAPAPTPTSSQGNKPTLITPAAFAAGAMHRPSSNHSTAATVAADDNDDWDDDFSDDVPSKLSKTSSSPSLAPPTLLDPSLPAPVRYTSLKNIKPNNNNNNNTTTSTASSSTTPQDDTKPFALEGPTRRSFIFQGQVVPNLEDVPVFNRSQNHAVPPLPRLPQLHSLPHIDSPHPQLHGANSLPQGLHHIRPHHLSHGHIAAHTPTTAVQPHLHSFSHLSIHSPTHASGSPAPPFASLNPASIRPSTTPVTATSATASTFIPTATSSAPAATTPPSPGIRARPRSRLQSSPHTSPNPQPRYLPAGYMVVQNKAYLHARTPRTRARNQSAMDEDDFGIELPPGDTPLRLKPAPRKIDDASFDPEELPVSSSGASASESMNGHPAAGAPEEPSSTEDEDDVEEEEDWGDVEVPSDLGEPITRLPSKLHHLNVLPPAEQEEWDDFEIPKEKLAIKFNQLQQQHNQPPQPPLQLQPQPQQLQLRPTPQLLSPHAVHFPAGKGVPVPLLPLPTQTSSSQQQQQQSFRQDQDSLNSSSREDDDSWDDLELPDDFQLRLKKK